MSRPGESLEGGPAAVRVEAGPAEPRESYVNFRGEIIDPNTSLFDDAEKGGAYRDWSDQYWPVPLLTELGLMGDDPEVPDWANLLEHIAKTGAVALTIAEALKAHGVDVNVRAVVDAAFAHNNYKRRAKIEGLNRLAEDSSNRLAEKLREYGYDEVTVIAAANTGRINDRFIDDPQERMASIRAKGPEAAIVGLADALIKDTTWQGSPEEAMAANLAKKSKPEDVEFFEQRWHPYYQDVIAYLKELAPDFDLSEVTEDSIYAAIQADTRDPALPDDGVADEAAELAASLAGPDDLREGKWDAWKSISDLDLAMKISGRFGKGLIGALRPDGKRFLHRWRRDRPLKEQGLVTVEQLDAMHEAYDDRLTNPQLAVRTARSWLSQGQAKEGISARQMNELDKYYKDIAGRLAESGILGDEEKFADLKERLEAYEEMHERREELEHSLDGMTSRWYKRAAVLGASAMRQAYRVGIPIGIASSYVYDRIQPRNHVTEIEVRNGRRIKAVAIGAVTLSYLAFEAYRVARGMGLGPDPSIMPGPDGGSLPSPSVIPSPSETGAPPVTEVPLPPTQPPVVPPEVPTHVYSEAAKTLDPGEGLLQTIGDAVPGLSDQQEARIAAEVAPDLLEMQNGAGEPVAYSADLGPGNVGLNEGDGTVSDQVLNRIYDQAAEDRFAPPMAANVS